MMMVAANAHTFPRAVAVGLLALAQLLGQSGDLARGKALFQSGGCVNCHRIGDAGSRVGPNLSDIGDRREAERLQKAILAPDDEVIPENRYVNVTMKDGTTVRGRLLNHDGLSVQLMDSKEQLRSIEISKMKGYAIVTKGLMPSFQGKLSAQDIAHLVTYLGSLKTPE